MSSGLFFWEVSKFFQKTIQKNAPDYYQIRKNCPFFFGSPFCDTFFLVRDFVLFLFCFVFVLFCLFEKTT